MSVFPQPRVSCPLTLDSNGTSFTILFNITYLDALAADNRSDSDSTSDPELDSEGLNGEDKPSDATSDYEGQLPPEHYLAQAEILNVSQI